MGFSVFARWVVVTCRNGGGDPIFGGSNRNLNDMSLVKKMEYVARGGEVYRQTLIKKLTPMEKKLGG